MPDTLTLPLVDSDEPNAVNLRAPLTLAEAGLSLDLVTQLVLKALFFSGELSGAELAKRLGVAFGVIEPSLESLKHQRHCEIVSGTMLSNASYRYRITTDGRVAGSRYLAESTYSGIAPVPLVQYRRYMTAVREAGQTTVTRALMRTTLAGLVLTDGVLDAIGPAINSGHSVFIYGAPGNGKTTIARAMGSMFTGNLAVPHAIEVDGNIIRVFDKQHHRSLPFTEDTELAPELTVDRRWEICKRPVVITGGELTLESLELGYDAHLGYYRAPHQLTANGGMLVIDDFGRQSATPSALLNRWMIPLENGIDYLTLQSGMTFEVPFHTFVAFATNIRPSELVDEAFLRRVRHKVYAEDPTADTYLRIFANCCRDRDIAIDSAAVNHLLVHTYPQRGIVPRACHPRDLVDQALLLAAYRGEPRVLTLDLLERAFAGYFVDQRG
ncbi:MAG: ATP-binding protein [Acidobacteriota bacterium]